MEETLHGGNGMIKTIVEKECLIWNRRIPPGHRI
jgi:hypothetical protein